jgi:hypothetical protein
VNPVDRSEGSDLDTERVIVRGGTYSASTLDFSLATPQTMRKARLLVIRNLPRPTSGTGPAQKSALPTSLATGRLDLLHPVSEVLIVVVLDRSHHHLKPLVNLRVGCLRVDGELL